MNITAKRVLIVVGTIIGAIAIALIIACFPSSKDNSGTSGIDGNDTSDELVSNVATSDEADYENMSKDELLKVIEEKDAEIEELMNKVDELTILAEQTTNAIVSPTPTSPPSNTGDNTSSGITSDNSTSGSTSGSESSSGGSTSGGSDSVNDPETSDTGL